MDAAPRSVFRRFDPDEGAQTLGVLWTMWQGPTTLRCTLATHPLGWELRAMAGETFLRSQVCKQDAEVLDVSRAWQTEAAAKGGATPDTLA